MVRDFSGRLVYPVLVKTAADGLAAIIGDHLRSSFAPGDDAAWELFKVARAFLAAGGPAPAEATAAVASAFLPHVSPARRARGQEMLVAPGAAASPPKLLRALIEVDRRKGTALSWRYLEGATRVAELTCRLDGAVSEPERRALATFEREARAEIEAAGVRWVRASPLADIANVVRGNVSTDLTHLGRAGDVIRGTVDEIRGRRPEPRAPTQTTETGGDLFAELDALVGLETVKRDVRQLANFVRVQTLRREQGLSTQETTKHLVFAGNPGTGKTTVARVLARIYKRLGVVARGHLVETDRGDLIGGYLGQTALKTKAVFQKAMGGVLFIDEAYSLARGEGDIYAREAVDTLVKLMEDHRDNVVVIVAGYTDEMETFLESNPGFRSRFKRVVTFPDYSDDELAAIFLALCDDNQFTPSGAAIEKLRRLLESLPREKGFGNGRLVRNLFEGAVAAQADRIVELPHPTREQMTTLEAEDIGL